MAREWSKYQKAVFQDVASGKGNTQIDAKAGSGKTSTIIESFNYVPRGKSVLMCAFSKPIQVELASRAPSSVTCATFHAIGYKACRKAFPKIGQPSPDKLLAHVNAVIGSDNHEREVRSNLMRTVSLAKGYLATSFGEVDEILDRHEIDPGEKREKFVQDALKVLNSCKQDTSRLDYDDMVWLPNVLGLALTRYNHVFIDESQDMNPSQINMGLNSILSNGRLTSCGDENQAIFRFRGADSNAIQNIVDRCHSKRMQLSISYRCARAIVQYAQELVPDFEAAPDAEDGKVETISENKIESLVKPGDFILSRTNAPLIKWCLTLLASRIPANIQGNDLGKSLVSTIKKSNTTTVVEFLVWLNQWREKETERLIAAGREISPVEDRFACLLTLSEGCDTVAEMIETINKLFAEKDDKSKVVCSSIHKSKGLERDRVFLLRSTCRPTQNQEEKNLLYVGATRARKHLFLAMSEGL